MKKGNSEKIHIKGGSPRTYQNWKADGSQEFKRSNGELWHLGEWHGGNGQGKKTPIHPEKVHQEARNEPAKWSFEKGSQIISWENKKPRSGNNKKVGGSVNASFLIKPSICLWITPKSAPKSLRRSIPTKNCIGGSLWTDSGAYLGKQHHCLYRWQHFRGRDKPQKTSSYCCNIFKILTRRG